MAQDMSSKTSALSNCKFEVGSMDLWEDGIVILSSDGIIAYTNKSWIAFSQKNGLDVVECNEGSNYLKVCAELTGKRSEAVVIAQGIRDVIEGRSKVFKFEYELVGPAGKSRFLLKVQPLSSCYPTNVILQNMDINEWNKIESDRPGSENHLSKILNNLQLAGVMLDSNANIIFCNDFLLELTGWRRKEVLNKNWFDIFLPADMICETKTIFVKTSETADFPSYYENEIATGNGNKRVIAWNNTVLKDRSGKISSIISIGEDITERKSAERSLLNSKGQLRTLVDTIPDLVWLKDQNGVYLMCNSKFERFFGVQEAEIIGKTDYDFVEKDLADFFTMNDRKAIKAGRPAMNEEELTYADDGHREYTETIKSPMYDSNGNLIGVLGVGRDITRRKGDEEELRKKEMQLRTAQKVGGFGSWEFDLDCGNADISEEALRIYGLEGKRYNIKELQKIPLPEYRSMLDTALKGLVERKSPYDMQFRILRQNDGEIRDIHSVAEYFAERNVVIGTIHDITELKQTENKLRKNEALLIEVGRIAKIGGWEYDVLSGKGTWTPEVTRIYEVDSDDQAGVEFGLNFYLPGSREVIEQAFQDAVENGRSYDLELQFITAKGNHKWVRTNGSPTINNGKVVKVTGSLQDITELKEARDKVTEEAVRRRILFEQSMDGLVVLDQNGKVFEANQRYAEMLGYSSEEIQKLYMWDWDTKYTREQLLEMIRLADSKGVIHETKHRRKDGSLIDVEISGNAAIFDGKKFIFCVCRDITERKQGEDILLHAKMAAEDANKSKGEFLATMSHELRTPLNSIIGFSDMMLGGTIGDLNEKQIRYMNHILKGGRHLLDLINDILDLSKVEAGKMELIYESFSVCDAVCEVTSLLSSLALRKGIEMDVKLEPQLGSINADKTKFKQILYNLASNAIKFTPDNGYVGITAHRTDNVLEISVTDNGIGIATKDLHKLFHPFKQLNPYLTREHEGTGLGLVLVKKYVEMHGGSVWVESEVGKGSIFTFTIPYC
ncbi:PAS domain S-box protein [Methanomethylovorans sp.]|uniref:PAS domain S-box protein n=1 Tax=Methanomethylovorans sp. TaxID=2758717 RepID=UPI00351C3C35